MDRWKVQAETVYDSEMSPGALSFGQKVSLLPSCRKCHQTHSPAGSVGHRQSPPRIPHPGYRGHRLCRIRPAVPPRRGICSAGKIHTRTERTGIALHIQILIQMQKCPQVEICLQLPAYRGIKKHCILHLYCVFEIV